MAHRLLLLALLCPWLVRAQGLDLSTAIDRALQANLGLTIRRYEAQQSRADLVMRQAEFDPALGASVNADESKRAAAASELEGSSQPLSQGQNAGLSITKKSAWGTTVKLGNTVDRAESDSEYATLNPSFDADMGVDIRQPLLKGGGQAVNTLGVKLGEIAVARADLDLQAQAYDLMRHTELTYWEVAYLQEAWAVQTSAVHQAEWLLAEARARHQAGLATRVDVVQAEAELAAKTETLIGARRNIEDAADKLLVLMGDIQVNDQLPAIKVPLPAPPDPLEITVAPAVARARKNQPEYLAQKQALTGQQYTVDAARRNRWPTLDLAGSAGYAGRADSMDEAYRGMFSRDGYDWRVGLEFSLPWGLRAEQAQWRKANLSLASETIRLDQLDQELILNIRQACRTVAAAINSIQAATATRTLRQQQHAMLKARYSEGLATLRDTVTAYNELEISQLRELKARMDLVTALVNLARLEGTLPQRHGLQWTEVLNSGAE